MPDSTPKRRSRKPGIRPKKRTPTFHQRAAQAESGRSRSDVVPTTSAIGLAGRMEK
jgi:hypothetical protein